ncbi:hypothetical protein NQ314_004606 [Rhamnusium bicolor]|uniref:Uncharacterized protein n=1 Tax=Rhamnusium bicolor TaxID=1586634 RepID=A0AAV8ZJ07_9CUCU|nr:hypothetical protein NQ314_004606 [Rhamnusium bicolor]
MKVNIGVCSVVKKELYENSENNKPRTIRGPTPYHENYNYGRINSNSLYSRSDEEKVNEEPISEEFIETDTNLDEINLNNENITKTIELKELSENNSKKSIIRSYSNIETNPLHENKKQIKGFDEQKEIDNKSPSGENDHKATKSSDNLIKTLIEVSASEENTRETIEKSEQYKSIVIVDTERPEKHERNEEENKYKYDRKESKHSHNYLKEFLESQKGSKKPLQNFISKKFSNLTRKNSKQISNLKENQFYSLPDISASKNLRICEKIDRKLRNCEKSSNFLKYRETSKENRFIVNIGRHFDITANSSIPVDFEVKIAKIPKKNKKYIAKDYKSDEQLIAAVKNLKETLHSSQINLDENHNISKPEIISVKTKNASNKEENTVEMALLYYKDECAKEFKEKLGTMRNYWDKMVGNQSKDDEEKESGTCKIIDLHTKVEEVKKMFEQNGDKVEEKPPSKVQITKQLFEPKPQNEKTEKISPLIKESCSYFENNSNYFFESDRQFESLCPTAVEIIDKKEETSTEKATSKTETRTTNKKKSHKSVAKSRSTRDGPEFDHVRYKVVKSDLFQKKIFANCEKESQFDGLMQYLQDYSFQELLIDNNIVIIEPIRSKVPFEPSSNKTMKNVTPLLHKDENKEEEDRPGLNRHFFYHPIRVNKEVNDDELPNPDTVRQVRQFFEGGVKRSQSIQDLDSTVQDKYVSNSVDPDKDRCSATDSNSHPSNMSDFGSQENLYDSIDNEIYCEYVSEDILEKIREHGTTVTYYGGRVVDQKSGQPVLTRAIMEEIRNNEKRYIDCNNCRQNGLEKTTEEKNKETYLGVKFRILKSNSCSSRLELVGTENMQETRKKFISQHKKLMKQNNTKKYSENSNETIKEASTEKENDDRLRNNKFCEKKCYKRMH